MEEYFFGSIPNVFQPSSQDVPEVPNVFLKRFTVTPHFFSHVVWPCSTSMYITCEVGRCGKGSMTKHAYILGEGSIFSAPYSKNIDDGPINWLWAAPLFH